MYHIYDDRLPFIRVKKLELTNFKGVQHGVLDFNCAKEFIPYNTKSDIMGIYGQNGSGKTSVIQALDTIKGLFCGYRLGSEFVKLIDVNAEYAKINIEFDLQYPDRDIEDVVTVTYEVKLKVIDTNIEDDTEGIVPAQQKTAAAVSVYDEIICTNMYEDGSIKRMHAIIDTSADKLFCSNSLEKFYFNNDSNIRNELVYLKRKLQEDSYSFVFSNLVSEIFIARNTENDHSRYYDILAELEHYARNYLFIVGSKSIGLVQLRAGIPINVPFSNVPLVLNEKTVLTEDGKKWVEKTIEQINLVLKTVIPDLQLELRTVSTITEKGEAGYSARIMSLRGDRIFPFEYESEGIIKIVSILADYIFAFNNGSATFAVDEFDSGIFEFLLGEFLDVFQEYGHGQFIFTSHNLRPLEVIDKKFVRFTTSDPDNRYYKPKNIGATNNLRDLYLREVQLGQWDTEVYRPTKSFKIVNALKDAGREMMSDVK